METIDMIVDLSDSNKSDHGMSYLLSDYSNKNVHLRSCFEMNSFVQTVRMLKYDCGQEWNGNMDVDSLVKRRGISRSGILNGVVVTCYMKEFAHLLDFEIYCIAQSDDIEAYKRLVDETINDGKDFELICCDDTHYDWALQIDRKIDAIHVWDLYQFKGYNHPSIEKRLRIAMPSDILKMDFAKMRIENNPMRFVRFQEEKLSYYNYMYCNENGDPIAFCSMAEYTSEYLKINCWYEFDEKKLTREMCVNIIETIINNINPKTKGCVWRVKDPEMFISEIVSHSRVSFINRERHIHFVGEETEQGSIKNEKHIVSIAK